MNTVQIIDNDNQFYPTPRELAIEMVEGINWSLVKTVLEPSAGDGRLIKYALEERYKSYRYSEKLDVDCVEYEPKLREILKYNFSEEKKDELYSKYAHIDAKASSTRTLEEHSIMDKYKKERELLFKVNLHVIHDDFFTFHTYKHYDLILMNPPFADGDKHLLKALEVQKNGGSIICLLNAETLLNPYSGTRKVLKQELDKYNADIKFMEGTFSNAERSTDVSVAIVKVFIPNKEYSSDIYDKMKKAEEEKIKEVNVTDLVVDDYLEQEIQYYNIEVKSTIELINQYYALKPHMSRVINSTESYGNNSILQLVTGDSKYEVELNEYLQAVRLKYWRNLFYKEKFMGKLTENLREEYLSKLDEMKNYEFTMFNIQQVMVEMNSKMSTGVKETIMKLFEQLTQQHSWYPECDKNKHYFNGWETNKAHKVSKKSIIPIHGIFSTNSWSKDNIQVYTATKTILDIEKVFNYLDGHMTAEVDLRARLEKANSENVTKNIDCKYFKVTFYKKGTMHIKYKNMDLVEKLNIYAAQNKNWLPPSYGKKIYKDMTTEEKEVVDSFQGEKEYNRVLNNRGYFLAEPSNNMLLLGE